MTIPTHYTILANQIAQRFQQFDTVQAIAISGSLASGYASDTSDMDLYIYTRERLTHEQRSSVIQPFATLYQSVDYWGDNDVFFDSETRIEVDVVYFNTDWITDQIARVLDRHEASLGYTTAFWHTIRQSSIIYDRDGWFNRLYQKAKS
ncbi:MAG: nucleotidyltransferase domain-containing protein, partial [Anaerolineae bacterium]|nr:nucleotidyltransferase domain-containing protein [Anaerolineae bacterium]